MDGVIVKSDEILQPVYFSLSDVLRLKIEKSSATQPSPGKLKFENTFNFNILPFNFFQLIKMCHDLHLFIL